MRACASAGQQAGQQTCDDSDPSASANMQAFAADACDGTLAGDACAHTCDTGFGGGSVTCTAGSGAPSSDGTWAVDACVTGTDCEGTWSACTAACETGGARTWTTTTAQAGGGNACPTVAPECAAGDGACTGQQSGSTCTGTADEIPASCTGTSSEETETAASCTGTADTVDGVTPTCDLDPNTDSTADCPAGCTYTAAFLSTPMCDLDASTDGTCECPAGCDYSACTDTECCTVMPRT